MSQILEMQYLIQSKRQNTPYYATIDSIPIEQFNEFPYPYFYRGQYKATYPIIIDRQAGWAPQILCHPTQIISYPTSKNVCFQIPCSTTNRLHC